MRLLVPLVLLAIAGCGVPSQEHRDGVLRAHSAMLDSTSAVPGCTYRDFDSDRAYHECRHGQAAERLALFRRSEYVALSDAPLVSAQLARYLVDASLTALDAGRTTEARALLVQTREALATARAERGDQPWAWSGPDETADIVEGRLALMDGDRATARQRLVAAGRVLADPAQLSFGPNVTLARDLLLVGDTTAVRTYFAVLDSVWTDGADTVAEWRSALDRGAEPDFGPNLIY